MRKIIVVTVAILSASALPAFAGTGAKSATMQSSEGRLAASSNANASGSAAAVAAAIAAALAAAAGGN